MTPQEIISADYLDILFEGRNKAYGAFALRKGERSRGLYAILFLLLPFTTLFALQRYLQKVTKADLHSKEILVMNNDNNIYFEPKPEAAPAGDPEPAAPAAASSPASTLPQIVESTDVDTATVAAVPSPTPPDNSSTGTGTAPAGGGGGGGENAAEAAEQQPPRPKTLRPMRP